MSTIFITGIDTNVGKTVATGLFARFLHRSGRSVITQKVVQTGCERISEDIETHRRLMGIPLTRWDEEGVTCPYIFKFPASPHLAARLEQVEIQPERIVKKTKLLEEAFDYVLLEGTGGFYVPLTDATTTLDYVAKQRYPLVIVSSGKLGSINHTLLTLEAAKQRRLTVLGILYNAYPVEHPTITEDSQHVFRRFLKQFGYRDVLIPIPQIVPGNDIPDIDCSELIK